MKTRIVTFHNGNLNPDLLTHQKMVFDKFGIALEQILTTLPHPEAIDHFLNSEQWDALVLFDADCIPLHATVVSDALNKVKHGHKVFGASQKASHIPGSKIYLSPCFMVMMRKTFEHIGKPSFKATDRGDVSEEISYGCRAEAIAMELLYPTHVEVPLWPLVDDIKFGYGTTYGDLVYHAFESNANHGSTQRFIDKCKHILH